MVRYRRNWLVDLEMKDVNWLETENENEEIAKNNLLDWDTRIITYLFSKMQDLGQSNQLPEEETNFPEVKLEQNSICSNGANGQKIELNWLYSEVGRAEAIM